MRDPTDLSAVDALRFATNQRIRPAAASEGRIRMGLLEHYGPAPEAISTGEATSASSGGLGDEPLLDLDLGPASPPAPAPPPSARLRADESEARREPGPAATAPLLRIAIAIATIVAVIGGMKLAKKILRGERGTPVAGEVELRYAKLRVELPDSGWLLLDNGNYEQYAGNGVTIRGSTLYRGSDADHPDDAMVLMRATGPFPPTISDALFDKMTRAMGRPGSFESKDLTIRDLSCQRSHRLSVRSAECDGIGVYDGVEYDLLGYVWFERSSMIFVVYLTSVDFDALDDEISETLPTIHILD
jgi:hypothetical protein